MSVTKEVVEWSDKAERDLKAALYLMRRKNDPLFDVVCFHCQQSAEKYLKAFLIAVRVEFPKTHDLLKLKDLCRRKDESFELLDDMLVVLNGYAVEIRYPGESSSLAEAKQAVAYAKKVKQFVRDKLRL